jgi:hypothetical protein
LIALSSRDPILTAFELSWELRRLSRMETEFRMEYNNMRKNVQEFATSLLDHARTSNELEIMLNYNANGENWEPGERHTLDRLKLAIKYKQKKVKMNMSKSKYFISINQHFSSWHIQMSNSFWRKFGMRDCRAFDEKEWSVNCFKLPSWHQCFQFIAPST